MYYEPMPAFVPAPRSVRRNMKSDQASRLRGWLPHLWVFVMPVAAVLIGYGLWFLLLPVVPAPDWLASIDFVVHQRPSNIICRWF
jgi:hypothetical protein